MSRLLESCLSSGRAFSRHVLVAAILLLPLRAFPATGVAALDEPSVAAKAGDRDFLIAVTRAGDRIVAVGEHGLIIYSDDNGLTWKQAVVPVSVALTDVRFASATDGWAVGHYGVILHSEDGGATWREQLNGIAANRLTLAAAQAAVAAKINAPGLPLALRRAALFMQAGPDKPFLAVWPLDGRHVIAFGAYRMAMETSDGGKTWTDWSLHIGDPLSHNLYDVTAAGDALYVVAETGLVFSSDDRGNNFAPVGHPGDATLFGALSTGDGGVLVFGVAGEAFRSSDDGKTWQSLQIGAGDNLIAACTLADGAILMEDENGRLFISHNHAWNFSTEPQEALGALAGIVQAANGDVVAVGAAGVTRFRLGDLEQK
jgi:photosystem II stability/assembly factor-like uncharacterized protein